MEKEHPEVRCGRYKGASCLVSVPFTTASLVGSRTNTDGLHCRMALFHFVTSNLPQDTIAPELDDRNAARSLKLDAEFTGEDCSQGSGVSEETMGNCVGYLTAVGFLSRPRSRGNIAIPDYHISCEQREALLRVGGRGALV